MFNFEGFTFENRELTKREFKAVSDISLNVLLFLSSFETWVKDRQIVRYIIPVFPPQLLTALDFLYRYDLIEFDDSDQDTHLYKITSEGREVLSDEMSCRLKVESARANDMFPNSKSKGLNMKQVGEMHNCGYLAAFSIAISHFLGLSFEERQKIISKALSEGKLEKNKWKVN